MIGIHRNISLSFSAFIIVLLLSITTSALAAVSISPIFSDNFEGGNTNKWTRTVGSVRADPAAAMSGSNYGLLVIVKNKKPRFVDSNTPTNERRYIAGFQLNINRLRMGNKNLFTLMEGLKGTKKVFSLQVRKYNKRYWLRGLVRSDSGKNIRTKWVRIPSRQPISVKVDWKAGDWKNLHTGYLKLFLNGGLKTAKTNINNDTMRIETVQVGVTDKIKFAHNVSGKFFVDNFYSEGSEESDANCSSAYPTKCLYLGIGDYDCAGGFGNGPNYVKGPLKVLPPDPFELDRDGDGIGCD